MHRQMDPGRQHMLARCNDNAGLCGECFESASFLLKTVVFVKCFPTATTTMYWILTHTHTVYASTC